MKRPKWQYGLGMLFLLTLATAVLAAIWRVAPWMLAALFVGAAIGGFMGLVFRNLRPD